MEKTHIIHNNEIKRIVMGTPAGHEHLRLLIELNDNQVFILPEAVIAAIVRAYCSIKTHPTMESIQMSTKEIPGRKSGFAQHQLIEEAQSNEEISIELRNLIEES